MAKRVLGFVGIVLGAIGVLLCLAVIVGAWWLNGPITDGLLTVFPPIEAALNFGDETVEQFGNFVGETQAQFAEVTDAKPIATALEDEIAQVAVYVDVASSLTDSADKTISGITQSVQSDARDNTASRAADRLLTTLVGVSETLDSAEALTQDVRDGRTDKIDQLNEQLDALEAHSAEVQTVIDQTSNDVTEIKRIIPRWINLGSLIVTLIFIWFGVAQFFLLRNGWHWLRQPTS